MTETGIMHSKVKIGGTNTSTYAILISLRDRRIGMHDVLPDEYKMSFTPEERRAGGVRTSGVKLC